MTTATHLALPSGFLVLSADHFAPCRRCGGYETGDPRVAYHDRPPPAPLKDRPDGTTWRPAATFSSVSGAEEEEEEEDDDDGEEEEYGSHAESNGSVLDSPDGGERQTGFAGEGYAATTTSQYSNAGDDSWTAAEIAEVYQLASMSDVGSGMVRGDHPPAPAKRPRRQHPPGMTPRNGTVGTHVGPSSPPTPTPTPRRGAALAMERPHESVFDCKQLARAMEVAVAAQVDSGAETLGARGLARPSLVSMATQTTPRHSSAGTHRGSSVSALPVDPSPGLALPSHDTPPSAPYATGQTSGTPGAGSVALSPPLRRFNAGGAEDNRNHNRNLDGNVPLPVPSPGPSSMHVSTHRTGVDSHSRVFPAPLPGHVSERDAVLPVLSSWWDSQNTEGRSGRGLPASQGREMRSGLRKWGATTAVPVGSGADTARGGQVGTGGSKTRDLGRVVHRGLMLAEEFRDPLSALQARKRYLTHARTALAQCSKSDMEVFVEAADEACLRRVLRPVSGTIKPCLHLITITRCSLSPAHWGERRGETKLTTISFFVRPLSTTIRFL